MIAALFPTGLGAAHYAGMATVVLVGACLQGIGGVGFAMFSAPIAALIYPELAPGPLLALSCPLALMSMLREFDDVDWKAAGGALLGRVAGTLGAVICLVWLPANLLAVLFALFILSGVALSVSGLRIAASRANIVYAGVASGLMGTITSAGAPPFALVMQYLPPARLRATLGCVFFVGAALSLTMLASVGRFGPTEILLGLWLLPMLFAGFFISGLLTRRVSQRMVRAMLLTLSALGAIALLAKVALSR